MESPGRDLSRWALISIAAAVVTIALKTAAWQLTGSVGLLSDAAESVVNLVAAVIAFIALKIAARPPDARRNFGYFKSEYFAATIEGLMIAVVATVIIVSAVDRLAHPRELEQVGVGLLISVLASAVNGGVAVLLIRTGRRHRSMALEADGKHLMTDVWTTAGVIIGVGLVAVTGWLWLDAVVAIAVAVNILVIGFSLVRHSTAGLMDTAVPDEDLAAIEAVLNEFRSDEVEFHDVRTRVSGRHSFAQLHMLVPGAWLVQRSHDLAEEVESRLRGAVDGLVPTIHIEPVEDPRAYEPWRR
ncbi:cation diffusion facilitator family transporter [Mycolicibacterium brumae]|uniref:Cation transporter n=1 Tax=Mycolicibacterium brumae TaxID=85968 RepID=A0A2G5PHE9_9MYCO|nr:cation diffusion facilitator family transporter [Mycolicibacterium brumae]MCV7192562.1 cation transporter [Mycolicibacterium brumae]PIB77729.1 cation transporter [Mycolicibacterium brumae]UWW10332.1 cation diffusion facilitator family transporter [Mycolicibacterium brumae]